MNLIKIAILLLVLLCSIAAVSVNKYCTQNAILMVFSICGSSCENANGLVSACNAAAGRITLEQINSICCPTTTHLAQ
ncbi:hypothetical protein GCK72_001646 [Caenorhabditis remanei]|uniref:Uncharacterized protein n=1 Tax=Caenorhabditis remanei TaxID=31234 RepID=A0A6A5HQ59_CAERE|nr:hypothetical protein GCK72_001646 [Caenorhabditis remanei]KAF1769829.1 hypothetical protein GCK72_001646 [Caenorhabditis remanei]